MANRENRIDYKELIPEIRHRIRENYQNNPDHYDQVDIDRIAQNEWSVLRFIKANRGDVNKSTQQLNASLEWRHSYGVNTHTISDFPQEFYKIGVFFINGVDHCKRPVLYVRLKAYKKFAPFVHLYKQFAVSFFEKVDREAQERGFVILLDSSGAGIASVDMDLLQCFINTLKDYYPYSLKHVIVYNLPRLFRPFFIIAKLWFSVLKIDLQQINDQELKNIIPREHLPFYLGGYSKIDFTESPGNSKPLKEWAQKYNLSQINVLKSLANYEPVILESQKLIQGYR